MAYLVLAGVVYTQLMSHVLDSTAEVGRCMCVLIYAGGQGSQGVKAG
jgi:hypothetical protein